MVAYERTIIYADLEGKKSNGIVGSYKSIIDAQRIFSDAQRYLIQNQVDQELVLVEGDHVVMTCILRMIKNHTTLLPI